MKKRELIVYQGGYFTIEWYYDENGNSQALDFFNKMSIGDQDKLLYLIKRIGDNGKISDKTKFRNEGDKIFAFKPKPNRFLCFFTVGKKIIITNAFFKNMDKLPKTEKDRAEKCRTEYLKRVKGGMYY